MLLAVERFEMLLKLLMDMVLFLSDEHTKNYFFCCKLDFLYWLSKINRIFRLYLVSPNPSAGLNFCSPLLACTDKLLPTPKIVTFLPNLPLHYEKIEHAGNPIS